MQPAFLLNRAQCRLFDSRAQRLDLGSRTWHAAERAEGDAVDARIAAAWLQRESGSPIRVPVGVIGPREAGDAQLAAAEAVGTGLAQMGFTLLCGGRQGVMEAACRGCTRAGGLAIGLLPDPDPAPANPYVGIALATGIGEARNALIARAALCLVAIGDSFGTLSEVALGRQFGKTVIGLADAARLSGVISVETAEQALDEVALVALGVVRA
jgi:uncharacterized protein (TIGR00725 family)